MIATLGGDALLLLAGAAAGLVGGSLLAMLIVFIGEQFFAPRPEESAGNDVDSVRDDL